ncbi:molecular chaperone [Stenotrophomonas sp. B1-1]|uniref:fimbrial biogenesis chaperone n=1 Tax=Stenotrophomonas sp. B1-1 TaxID=2710648 RepID=UPI0013D991E7|nr:molecular chaperone [Stenotrophomonas sp. B1-1]
MNIPRLMRLPLSVAVVLASSFPSQAGVRLGGTRLVYATDQQEATLSVQNTGTLPVLVQAWITELDRDVSVDQAEVPFVMSPPVFRLQPGSAQSLRIRHLAPAKITDREQAYWLNVYEIPGRPAGAPAENLLEMATRTRIKLFMRPHELKEPVAAAPERLTWHLARDTGTRHALVVTNPTPYHVNFGEVGLVLGERRVPHSGGDGKGGMVEPYASRAFSVDLDAMPSAPQAYAKVINDHGGMRVLHWPVTP